MTLEQDIVDRAAKQLAQDIDIGIIMNAMDWKPFELSEGRVYGARYLTVHPNNSTQWNEMMAWMVETFGPSAHDGVWTPSMRWYANNAKFWFRNQKDRDWFVLRWS